MNEPKLKPVAWMQRQGDYSEPCTWELDDGMAARGWRQEPLYAIPHTHRIVSVELLRLAHSECFKNFSSSDSKTVASQLRAIIDNKGQS